jgi:hypothetical protein
MKTSCVSLVCPSCNSIFEIFLRKQPDLIILNCPTCNAAISSFEGQSLAIDSDMMSKLKKVTCINAKLQSDRPLKFEVYHSGETCSNPHVITKDDIIDLQIDLYKCKTFEDVMRLICQSK